YLLFPDILSQHEQDVLGLILVGEIQIRPAALEVKALHRRIEVNEADGHAGDADDRQTGSVALPLDEPAPPHVDIEGVGEDVDRVESDFPGHADAVGRVLARLSPRRVDEAEFHGIASRSKSSLPLAHVALRSKIEKHTGNRKRWLDPPAAFSNFRQR